MVYTGIIPVYILPVGIYQYINMSTDNTSDVGSHSEMGRGCMHGASSDRHTSGTASSQRLRRASVPVARLSKPSAPRQCARKWL